MNIVKKLLLICKIVRRYNNVFVFVHNNAFSETATEAAGTMSSASVALDLADSSRKSVESSLRDISQQSEMG